MHSALLFTVTTAALVGATSPGGHHAHAHLHAVYRSLNASATDPFEMVARALEELGPRNNARLTNPSFNNNEFGPIGELQENRTTFPSLLASNSSLTRRNANASLATGYSIPPDLANAARIVTEATPQNITSGPQRAEAEALIAQFSVGVADTNMPAQQMVAYDGLDLVVQPDPSLDANASHPVGVSLQQRDLLDERSTTPDYWMAVMPQLGASPYAESGYKVFRNVMTDYGAKGDGKTDDTAAINRAISDGNRCGATCGSSTIKPAVVYFPPGTYLVSSPLIQYYNTQFLGHPTNRPTILASSSFVGLGVITSDVYTGPQTEWYINTNNFLRSVRNFWIDISNTALNANISAIHWQVAQGTSLENIVFLMSKDQSTTHVGVYMENGSGGFLGGLIFIGGKFGAWLGNQQFTTSGVIFSGCQTAMQVHWDWAWTMQNIVIDQCGQGLIIVGGAGGPFSTGQGVGSLVLVDASISNTPIGIRTTLYQQNSTSFLIQNTVFKNVTTAVLESTLGTALLAGGQVVNVDSWGFGRVNDDQGWRFINGANIPVMNRSTLLLANTSYNKPNFFTRSRPSYFDLGGAQLFDLKQMGAKGDGVTDDTAVLNFAFAAVANMSGIVWIPYGVYLVTDTVKIPTNSRIIGQAWAQIMGSGPKFQDANNPHVMVQVGESGESGVIEIQDLLFTVSGPTAGAVLVEWNTHESTQGSAALWDSHFRVGGAVGSNLQLAQCPKGASTANPNCVAASLMLRLTRQSSAYIQNSWAWAADHDLDAPGQDQINVYSGRGILVESQGPTWMYGTASEHSVLYQYELSGAKDVLLGMIQTETPYYQNAPQAPAPFAVGLFPNDPTFAWCSPSDVGCAMAFAIRIVDSSSIYMLGAGLYSWFSQYSQACLATDTCQDRLFGVLNSVDIWAYNICTKGARELISPNGQTPTWASMNKNGFLSSIMAFTRNPTETIGQSQFPGWQLYNATTNAAALQGLPDICKTALTASIGCDPYVQTFTQVQGRQSLGNLTLENQVCSPSCGASLQTYFNTVSSSCKGYNISSVPANVAGGIVWAGYNETCLKDPKTGAYCIDEIAAFQPTASGDYAQADLCSTCNVNILRQMQASPYSEYDDYYQSQLEYVYATCGLSGPTDLQPYWTRPPKPPTLCPTGKYHQGAAGDTCDTISMANNASSAGLFAANPGAMLSCTNVPVGNQLCLPPQCAPYTLKPTDNCTTIETAYGLAPGSIVRYNPTLLYDCSNIQVTATWLGHVLCISPPGGAFVPPALQNNVTTAPGPADGFASTAVPPPSNATVAQGTNATACGSWYVAAAASTEQSCPQICMQFGITTAQLLAANPSLSKSACTGSLVQNDAYCVAALRPSNGTLAASS